MHRSFRAALNKATQGSLWAAGVVALSGTLACGMPAHQAGEEDAEDMLGMDESAALTASYLGTDRAALDAGTYLLHPKADTSLCLDVAWASNTDGARVQITKCNGNAAQNWSRSGNMWKVFGNKCLNAKGGTDRDGVRLEIRTCSDADSSDQWTLNGGQVAWKKNPKRCIDVVDGAMRDGTDVQLWTCDASQKNVNQLWSWAHVGTAAAAPAKTTAPAASTPAPAKTTTPATTAPAAAKPAPAASTPTPAKTTTTPPTANQTSSSALVGPSPAGLDVAPYFWTWAQWGDYPIRTLKEGMSKANLKSATISFELSNKTCAPQGAFDGMGADIKAFRAAGNRVILSYGGATDDPPYLQKACSSASALAAVIAKQMTEFDTHNLDFDIEGSNLGDTTSNNRLIDALVILQKQFSDMYVSYTLPVDADTGLPTQAVTLAKSSIAKGVKVSRYNLMTMDYGEMPKAGKTSADMVLASVDATVAQLKKLYPQVPEATIYHMVGITPLIGQNDPPGSGSFYFTVSDAKKTAAYAKQHGVGLLSYWGLMRDRSGSSSSNNDYSNTPQKDFDFLNTFRSAQ